MILLSVFEHFLDFFELWHSSPFSSKVLFGSILKNNPVWSQLNTSLAFHPFNSFGNTSSSSTVDHFIWHGFCFTSHDFHAKRLCCSFNLSIHPWLDSKMGQISMNDKAFFSREGHLMADLCSHLQIPLILWVPHLTDHTVHRTFFFLLSVSLFYSKTFFNFLLFAMIFETVCLFKSKLAHTLLYFFSASTLGMISNFMPKSIAFLLILLESAIVASFV